jgi:hypothetical protein
MAAYNMGFEWYQGLRGNHPRQLEILQRYICGCASKNPQRVIDLNSSTRCKTSPAPVRKVVPCT